MKILRIITSMNPEHGGPSQGIRNSLPALEPLGISSEVLCFDIPGMQYIGDAPFAIHAIGPAKGPYAYCPNLHPWLLCNLDRFDAIIIHGLWLYNSYGTLQVLKKFKNKNHRTPKLFVMPHGMLDPYFQKTPGRRLKAIRNRLFWWLIERHVINQADGVLFTCEQELLLARETFSPYYPKKELNVGYGIQAPPPYSIELTHQFKQAISMEFGKPYWLFLSRVHEKKGINLLITAYQELLTEVSELPPLVIAGPGLDTPYGKEMMALARPTPQILFTGMLQGDAKWGALYGCEAFVLPSHQENFGIAIVEALACGKPVLISDKVNIWREIEAGGGGLVDTNTKEGTLRMLRHWLGLPDHQKRNMATAAKLTFETQFTIENAASRMVAGLKKTSS